MKLELLGDLSPMPVLNVTLTLLAMGLGVTCSNLAYHMHSGHSQHSISVIVRTQPFHIVVDIPLQTLLQVQQHPGEPDTKQIGTDLHILLEFLLISKRLQISLN